MAGPAGEILVAGSYELTWNSVSLGLLEGDQQSVSLEQQTKGEHVQSSNRYGKTTIETFALGVDVFVQFIAEEYISSVVLAWWPLSATLGRMGVIARSYRSMAAPLVLTATAGTPASIANNLNVLTATYAILAASYNTKLLMGPTHRKLPIRQQLYPYDLTSGGVYGHFGVV